MIPITSARSGANFCFALTPTGEGRAGGGSGEKRKTVGVRKVEAGKVLKLCLAAMLGEMSVVLPQPVREREVG